MVEIYQHGQNNKRCQWSGSKKVINVDYENRTITVPGRSRRTVCATFEDVRLAIENGDLAKEVAEAIDQIDDEIDDKISSSVIEKDDTESITSDDDNVYRKDVAEDEIDVTIRDEITDLLVGEGIEVYWPMDNAFYPGNVSSIEDGISTISYDHGDVEFLNMSEESWKYQANDNITVPTANASILELNSSKQETLAQISNFFGNMQFIRFQGQGFEQYPMIHAKNKEELQLLNIVKPVLIKDVPSNTNIINSHTLYKVKRNDDDTLALKARIVPHRNEYKEKEELTNDCATCSSSGIRIVKSIATLKGWKIKRGDAKGVFLKTRKAQRDVWMIPPWESKIMRATHR